MDPCAFTNYRNSAHTNTPSILTTGSVKKQKLLASLVRATGTTATGGTDWLRLAARGGGAGGGTGTCGTGGTCAASWGSLRHLQVAPFNRG